MIDGRVGELRVVRRLGRGGAGQVDEVVDARGRRWAQKTLTPGDATALLRFRREAEVLAALDHPNIVRLHAAALDASPPHLLTELLPGGSLEERLRAGPLPAAAVAALGRELAGALAHAHARGVLHRDVKPSNVVFDAEGRPKLVDFGLARAGEPGARLTRSGEVMGTPAFMAPEQAQGEGREDERTDVYGLGATLHAAASGAAPFAGPTSLSVLEALLSGRPAPLPPGLPPDLAAVIRRAMAREPGARFQSALALEEALAREPRRRSIGRRSLAAAVLAAVAAAAVAVARPPAPGPGPARAPASTGATGTGSTSRPGPGTPAGSRVDPPAAPSRPDLPAWLGSFAPGDRPSRPPTGCDWLHDQAGVRHRRTDMTLLWIPPTGGQPGFFAGQHELTWGDVARAKVELVEVPLYVDRRADLPVHSIMPERAAQLTEELGLRLPTDAEWGRLARGPDGRRLPWGDSPPWTPDLANLVHPDRPILTLCTPVGSFPRDRSPAGCLDVLGNVAELVTAERGGPPSWLRGGSWNQRPCDLELQHPLPTAVAHGVGLRAVLDAR